MSGGTATEWIGIQAASLLWEDLGDGFALFQPRSGQTHFLTELAGLVLRCLGSEGVPFDAIVHSVAEEAELEVDTELTENLEVVLMRFEYLGLAARVDS